MIFLLNYLSNADSPLSSDEEGETTENLTFLSLYIIDKDSYHSAASDLKL